MTFFLEWKPDFSLTPQQIMEGRFTFHTCVRVRLDPVNGETFFANQDGHGQQENIEYFQAGFKAPPVHRERRTTVSFTSATTILRHRSNLSSVSSQRRCRTVGTYKLTTGTPS